LTPINGPNPFFEPRLSKTLINASPNRKYCAQPATARLARPLALANPQICGSMETLMFRSGRSRQLKGLKRKLLAQLNKSGLTFVFDRVSGEGFGLAH
jgi:hypothetical protein